MNNRHEFQVLAKKFRGGRISLAEFTDSVFPTAETPHHDTGLDNRPVDLRLPVRPENSHKGDFGRVLLIGGSAEMPGAIALSGLAAIKSGAGLVTVLTPSDARIIVASYSPCLMTAATESAQGMFDSAAMDEILERSQWADVVALGPGMGRSVSCQEIASRIYQELEKPVVVDADGINNLVDANIDWSIHAGDRIMTPHPGEFSRMVGETAHRRSEMELQATEMARRSQVVILLKGHRSHVTNGERSHRNETGNAGMATAGSGDVLTGIIASLIGQKMDVFESAAIASHLHGLAADAYSESQHSASLIATDLIEFLPAAMAELAEQSQR